MTYPRVQAGIYAAAGIAGIIYASVTSDGTDVAIGLVWSASCVVGIGMELRAIRLAKSAGPATLDVTREQHSPAGPKRRRPSHIGRDKPLVHDGKAPPDQG